MAPGAPRSTRARGARGARAAAQFSSAHQSNLEGEAQSCSRLAALGDAGDEGGDLLGRAHARERLGGLEPGVELRRDGALQLAAGICTPYLAG